MATRQKDVLVIKDYHPDVVTIWIDSTKSELEAIRGVDVAYEQPGSAFNVYLDPRYDREETIREIEELGKESQ